VTWKEEYERAQRKVEDVFEELRRVQRVLGEIVDATLAKDADKGVTLASIRQAALIELGRLKRWIGL
jgi:hypothetical protein